VPTYVDRSLADDEYIVCQAGSHTDTLQMKYEDYVRAARATVLDIALPS
jgi:prolyl-tRNA editing enzyme YbaK/EbsC (Cys-tRNA(Pro) deacylase)